MDCALLYDNIPAWKTDIPGGIHVFTYVST